MSDPVQELETCVRPDTRVVEEEKNSKTYCKILQIVHALRVLACFVVLSIIDKEWKAMPVFLPVSP